MPERPWDSPLGKGATVNERCLPPWSHRCSMSYLSKREFPVSGRPPCPLRVDILVISSPLSFGPSCAPAQSPLPAPSQAPDLLGAPRNYL